MRKVLGASVPSLIGLLSNDFLNLVTLAFLLAAPLAYFGMQRWLEGLAYRIEIGPESSCSRERSCCLSHS